MRQPSPVASKEENKATATRNDYDDDRTREKNPWGRRRRNEIPTALSFLSCCSIKYNLIKVLRLISEVGIFLSALNASSSGVRGASISPSRSDFIISLAFMRN